MARSATKWKAVKKKGAQALKSNAYLSSCNAVLRRISVPISHVQGIFAKSPSEQWAKSPEHMGKCPPSYA